MQSQFVRYDAGNWGGFSMKIIPVWALLPHRPCNKINLQSRDQPLIIQVEIITNISSSQQNGDEGQVLIADASHILWLEHICWSCLSVGFLIEPLIINHQTRIREDIIELNRTIDLEPCCQNISSISRTSLTCKMLETSWRVHTSASRHVAYQKVRFLCCCC